MQATLAVLTFSDWLSLAQTIILLLTGVIVFWYTWETQQLRKTGVRQVELQQEQGRLTREALDRDVQEQIRASRPYFNWQGGGSGPDNWYWECFNGGGQVSHLSIHSDAPLDLSLSPKGLLPPEAHARVEFRVRVPKQQMIQSWDFEIRYRTRLDVAESKKFRVIDRGVPQEI